MKNFKGQIIVVAVILMTAFSIFVITIWILSSSQLSISYDILGGTKSIIAADQALDCYFFIEAGKLYNDSFNGEGECKINCAQDNCIFSRDIKFKFTTTTFNGETIIYGYGIFKDNIFRVLEAKEIIY